MLAPTLLIAVLLGVVSAQVPPTMIFSVICAAALLIAILRQPAIALLIIALVGGFGGRVAAHWLVPGVGLPLLECLLAVAAGAALWHLGRVTPNVSLTSLVLWMPAFLLSLVLITAHNEGDLVSGVRDVAIFAYPLLIFIVVCSTRPAALAAFLQSRRLVIITFALVTAIAALGTWNLVTGQSYVLPTGEERALGGEYAAPLAFGLLLGVWTLTTAEGARRLSGFLLIGPSMLGFLFVGHRSAYLAAAASLTILAILLWRRHAAVVRTRVLWSSGMVAVLAVLALSFTSLGQQTIVRLGTLTDSADATSEFRKQALAEALQTNGVAEFLFGEGVGTQATDFSQAFDSTLGGAPSDPVTRFEPHNGLVTAYVRAGLVGVLVLAVPMVIGAWRLARDRVTPSQSLLASVAVFGLVMAMFNVFLESLYFAYWFWVPFAVGVHLAAAQDHSVATQRRITT